MTFYDEDEAPIESRDEHVETFGVDDDPAEEEAEFADAMAEAHVAAMEAARLSRERQGLDVDLPPAMDRINALDQILEQVANALIRIEARLERLEADLGVEDEFGDRPLPLDTPDVAAYPPVKLSKQAVDLVAEAGPTTEDLRALHDELADPTSLAEINRRARAEAAAMLEHDLAEGQGLAGVPEMVPAPLDDDMTAHEGFR